jgi:hypothetical protein
VLQGRRQAFPDDHVAGVRSTNRIARPGIAEAAMLTASGFDVVRRGALVSTIEWPDADIAWRALSIGGPMAPVLRAGDVEVIRRDVLAAIDHRRDRRCVYHLRNDHQFVIPRAA